MQRFVAYFKIILICNALHKHSNIANMLFASVSYSLNFLTLFTVFLVLKQNNKKSKNVNIPIKISAVYFLTDAHE